MTDMQERINRLLSISESTRNMMLQVQQKAVDRAEAGVIRERQQCLALKCAGLLSEFNLKMGQTVQHNSVSYVLADVDARGCPIGHRIKADGSINPTDRFGLCCSVTDWSESTGFNF